MDEYSVTLIKSSRELNARDRIRYMNFAAATALDTIVTNDKESVSIAPIGYAEFHVHNERAENPEYDLFIIETSDGKLYKTGSASFFSRFREIYDTMVEYSPDESFTVSIIKRPSQRYKGKYMLLCQLD